MTDATIDRRMKKLQELEGQKAELEAKINEIKDSMKAELGEAEQIETDNFIIRWTRTITNRFDSTAFKKDHAKLFAAYTKPSESRRFSYAVI